MLNEKGGLTVAITPTGIIAIWIGVLVIVIIIIIGLLIWEFLRRRKAKEQLVASNSREKKAQ